MVIGGRIILLDSYTHCAQSGGIRCEALTVPSLALPHPSQRDRFLSLRSDARASVNDRVSCLPILFVTGIQSAPLGCVPKDFPLPAAEAVKEATTLSHQKDYAPGKAADKAA